MYASTKESLKQMELLRKSISDSKTRIDVDGTSGYNDFFVIVNGSVEFYTELFKESLISKRPIIITSATTGNKILINPDNVFNVTITEEIEEEKYDE